MILSDRDIKAVIKSGRVENFFESRRALFFSIFMPVAWTCDWAHFQGLRAQQVRIARPEEPQSFANNMRGSMSPMAIRFIQPGEFVLGVTQETVTIPDDLLRGRSQLAWTLRNHHPFYCRIRRSGL